MNPRCPKCGDELQAVAGPHDWAPWLCNECHRGFWHIELSAEARAAYRPLHHDWGFDAAWLEIARAKEVVVAQERGTSLREDQLPLVSDGTLRALSGMVGVHPGFRAKIDQHLASRRAA